MFAVDLERQEITFFSRGDNEARPLGLVEDPKIIEALKRRSVPWK